MFLYTISFLMVLISFMFYFMVHPLAMGLTLIIQTIIVSMFLGFLFPSFWYSYILFLIFIGGMLVLFIYIVSLASNEMFSFSMKSLLSILLIFPIGYISMTLKKTFNYYEINSDMLSEETMMKSSEWAFSMSKLYSFPECFITALLIVYLLITLIAIVKITGLAYGPLRKTFYE